MIVTTKANLISVYDDSFIGRDGQPVKAYKVQAGNAGEAAIELPVDEAVYSDLLSKGITYKEGVTFKLELRKFGNKLSVRCVGIS